MLIPMLVCWGMCFSLPVNAESWSIYSWYQAIGPENETRVGVWMMDSWEPGSNDPDSFLTFVLLGHTRWQNRKLVSATFLLRTDNESSNSTTGAPLSRQGIGVEVPLKTRVLGEVFRTTFSCNPTWGQRAYVQLCYEDRCQWPIYVDIEVAPYVSKRPFRLAVDTIRKEAGALPTSIETTDAAGETAFEIVVPERTILQQSFAETRERLLSAIEKTDLASAMQEISHLREMLDTIAGDKDEYEKCLDYLQLRIEQFLANLENETCPESPVP